MKLLIIALIGHSLAGYAQESINYSPLITAAQRGFTTSGVPLGEKDLYNWHPQYSVNLPAFDNNNVAYFRRRAVNANDVPPDGFELFRNGVIERRPYLSAIYSLFPQGSTLQSTLGANGRRHTAGVFDSSNRMFNLLGVTVNVPGQPTPIRAWLMLTSTDKGVTWTAFKITSDLDYLNGRCPTFYPIGSKCAFPKEIDYNRGYSQRPIPAGSLSLLLYEKTGTFGDAANLYDDKGVLSVLSLDTSGESLEYDFFYRLSDQSLGIGSHSGGSANIIRYDNKIFTTWIDGTSTLLSGSPTFVGEFNIATKTLTKKIVAYTFPANDVHNQPAIALSSRGIIHVIAGTHNSHMLHAQSTTPYSISTMSTAVPMTTERTGDRQAYGAYNLPNMEGGVQTYVALVIDSKDTLHAVFRQWRIENRLFKGNKFLSLNYQSYKAGRWSTPKVLVYPNQAGYFVYYHHLTLDRKGRLFLSFHRSSEFLPYRTSTGTRLVPEFSQPALLMSKNEGTSWFLATNKELIEGADTVSIATKTKLILDLID